jgi:hypothetical protein
MILFNNNSLCLIWDLKTSDGSQLVIPQWRISQQGDLISPKCQMVARLEQTTFQQQNIFKDF